MASLFASNTPPENPAEEPGRAAANRRVGVLLPLPLSGAYDYGVPEGMAVAPGDSQRTRLTAVEGQVGCDGQAWRRRVLCAALLNRLSRNSAR